MVDKVGHLTGEVSIDKTVGNDTFFVVTWEKEMPKLFVEDPTGNVYDEASFVLDQTLCRARLKITGTAQVWIKRYPLFFTICSVFLTNKSFFVW